MAAKQKFCLKVANGRKGIAARESDGDGQARERVGLGEILRFEHERTISDGYVVRFERCLFQVLKTKWKGKSRLV